MIERLLQSVTGKDFAPFVRFDDQRFVAMPPEGNVFSLRVIVQVLVRDPSFLIEDGLEGILM